MAFAPPDANTPPLPEKALALPVAVSVASNCRVPAAMTIALLSAKAFVLPSIVVVPASAAPLMIPPPPPVPEAVVVGFEVASNAAVPETFSRPEPPSSANVLPWSSASAVAPPPPPMSMLITWAFDCASRVRAGRHVQVGGIDRAGDRGRRISLGDRLWVHLRDADQVHLVAAG